MARSANPFPGLRPFRDDEDHLFFGREEQTVELVKLLRRHRFTAVVGTSGSGKSSLVRAGVLPELLGGTMNVAGSAWEVAVLRPGGSPIGNLARALCDAGLYDGEDPESVLEIQATLRHSGLGLAEAMRQSEIEEGANLLVVVDQFEEIFRFHDGGEAHQNDATAFVNLLLEASRQQELPLYVSLTMRSDYLGDCARFRGLAEAVNAGEYLIPQLDRRQLRRAIEGPVKVGGGRIANRFVQELLNDAIRDHDRLPVLQHALMRTWEHWQATSGTSSEMDLEHYEDVGGMAEALSRHADEIYDELASDEERRSAEGIFRALTERGSDNRGIRRPTRLVDLSEITGAGDGQVTAVVEAFRAPGRTFLMPPQPALLEPETVIDLSHESLMRVWTRLESWVDDEAQSVRIYRRLAESAALHRQGKAALFQDPELGIASSWRQTTQPNAAWAERYREGFDEAMAFLDKSLEAQSAAEREREAARQRELEQARERAEEQRRSARRMRLLSIIAFAIAAIAVVALYVAVAARDQARQAQLDAKKQLYIADMNRAARAWQEGDISRLKRHLEAHRPAAGEADLRGFEWYHWWRAAHLERKRFHGPNSRPHASLQVSDDRRTVWAFVDGSAVETYDARSLRLTGRAGLPHSAQNPAGPRLAPDGVHLAVDFWNADQLWLTNTRNWMVDRVLSGQHPKGSAPLPVITAFAPDGVLATGDWLGRVVFWTPAAPYAHVGTVKVGGAVQEMAFSRDGRHLYVAAGLDLPGRPELDGGLRASAEAGLVVIDTTTRTVVQVTSARETVRSVSVSPDGQTVATGGSDATVRLWRPSSEGLEPHLEMPTSGPVWHVRFSPSGRRLAAGTDDARVFVWELDRPREPPQVLVGHSDAVRDIAFVDDDRLWSAGLDSTVVWDLEDAVAHQTIRGTREVEGDRIAGRFLAYRDDGRSLLFWRADGRLELWDIDRGAALELFDSEVYAAFGTSDDGAVVAGWTADGRLRVLGEGGALLYDDAVITGPEVCPPYESSRDCLLSFSGLTVSRDGDTVVWTVRDREGLRGEAPGGVFLRRMGRSSESRILDSGWAGRPVLSADGSRLAVVDFGGGVWVFDMTQSPPALLSRGGGWGAQGPATFLDGSARIASGSQDR